ncbi:MAG: DUF2147 domain-containing protein [Pseudoxanthomonas sp.]
MKSKHRAAVLLAAALFAPLAAWAADPVGRWTTIDDETGKPKSIVEIYKTDQGTLAGKVVQVLQSDQGPHPRCVKCSGPLKDKPVEGMVILWGLKPDGDQVWSGGNILDPHNGKTYKSKITLIEDGRKLQMRGYIGFEALGRTQTWVRD